MNTFQDRPRTMAEIYPKPTSFFTKIAPPPLINTTLNEGGIIAHMAQIPEALPDLTKPVLLPPRASKVFSNFLYKNKEAIIGILIFTTIIIIIKKKLKQEEDEENTRMN